MILRRATILALVLFATQCSLLHKQASVRQKGSSAALQMSSKIDLFIFSIDNKRVAQNNNDRYELAPGVHTITLRSRKQAVSEKKIPRKTEFDLSIDAKADVPYQVEYVKNEKTTRWSCYIIDAVSKNRVSYIITSED